MGKAAPLSAVASAPANATNANALADVSSAMAEVIRSRYTCKRERRGGGCAGTGSYMTTSGFEVLLLLVSRPEVAPC